jgi:hypothetical protein
MVPRAVQLNMRLSEAMFDATTGRFFEPPLRTV